MPYYTPSTIMAQFHKTTNKSEPVKTIKHDNGYWPIVHSVFGRKTTLTGPFCTS